LLAMHVVIHSVVGLEVWRYPVDRILQGLILTGLVSIPPNLLRNCLSESRRPLWKILKCWIPTSLICTTTSVMCLSWTGTRQHCCNTMMLLRVLVTHPAMQTTTCDCRDSAPHTLLAPNSPPRPRRKVWSSQVDKIMNLKFWGASKKFMENLFMGKFPFHLELKNV